MRETLDSLEEFAVEVIYDRRRGVGATVLRMVLSGLEQVWGLAVAARLFLYRNRVLQEHNLGCMVISIGNLTVGGTGKTPVVEMFAKALSRGGRRVAVLSRGYKSAKPPLWRRVRNRFGAAVEESPPRVVSEGGEVLLDSNLSGDEPYMLAKNLRDVAVLVDKDRVKAVRWALRNYGSDTFLLDDGLQYLRLKHRIEVVLVDANAPFGTGHMLPRGTLREPPRQLARAHYVFITKCGESGNGELIERIRRYNRSAEIIQCTHAPQYLENVTTGERKPLGILRNQYVGLMCGIAMPESLESTLTKLGARLETRRFFTDHHRYSRREVARFINRCVNRDLAMIITTEKDAVRFPEISEPDLPIYFLRVEIEILEGRETWEKCVGRICDAGMTSVAPAG